MEVYADKSGAIERLPTVRYLSFVRSLI
jgi:hypothetical protein